MVDILPGAVEPHLTNRAVAWLMLDRLGGARKVGFVYCIVDGCLGNGGDLTWVGGMEDRSLVVGGAG